MPGRFITFEGIDGAGKSSHLEPLAAWLRARGHDVLVTREPGGTPLAEALRELLLHRPMDAMTEALLVFAARRDHLRQSIEPALAAGRTMTVDAALVTLDFALRRALLPPAAQAALSRAAQPLWVAPPA
jgi:dTMP kinase